MNTGRVFQINISTGGLPKLPVREVEVLQKGLVGDGHDNINIHGGVDRAVCLFSLERILSFQQEGHPIYPGATGENITVSGINWDNIVPGVQLSVGDELELEITTFDPNPCPKIQSSFYDGDVKRMVYYHNPGWARMYAQVLKPGKISIGDVVQILRSKEEINFDISKINLLETRCIP